ncbi:MAG: hypothetical protein KAI61_05780, partial [Alphaproteobacteria bacterium]|nr:hypothetical protein [Alphaproteobacteria bacterium]
AMFIRNLAKSSDKEKVSKEDVKFLTKDLQTKGHLFDTNHMVGCIKNLERFGHLNFTDNDARLIKSKMGQRLTEVRRQITFLGGILILLGLIGTYMGLLKTIDAVGGVMQEMSGMNSVGAEDDMSNFIGALAEPLQGMGLAFSSSLFGITGSLLISVLGLFGKFAQNEFIENISRWIDDRIPKFASTVEGSNSKALGKTASAENLRTWLAGFVNMSVKTNNRLNQLITILGNNSSDHSRIMQAIDVFEAGQKNTRDSIQTVNASMKVMIDHHNKTLECVSRNNKSTDKMQKDMAILRNCAQDMTETMPMMARTLIDGRKSLYKDAAAKEKALTLLKHDLHEQTDALKSLDLSLTQLPKIMIKHHRKTLEYVGHNDKSTGEMQKDMAVLRNCAEDVKASMPTLIRTLINNRKPLHKDTDKENELTFLKHDLHEQADAFKSLDLSLAQLPEILNQLNSTQDQLAKELSKLQGSRYSSINRAINGTKLEKEKINSIETPFNGIDDGDSMIKTLLALDEEEDNLLKS